MEVICKYCGAQNRPTGERCGRCGKFYSGTEEFVVDEASVVAANVADSVQPAEVAASSNAGESGRAESDDGDSASGSPAPAKPDDGDGTSTKNSEALVRPRKLSPQFRRRVEMTWQPSLQESPQSSLVGPNMRNAERTLSSDASSTGTRSATSTLSIGTRRITTGDKAARVDYELKSVIGEGSMGKVWSARQTSLDRNVAVKRPRPELAASGSIGESQFISEVVVTGQLEHPNIVPIYDLARDPKGLPFYSMKHVQGLAWNELIANKTLQENLEILMKVCDAIAFAHDRSFLHRDIKPHNVMVGEFGEVSVMDWGIAVSLKQDPDKPWAAIATGPAGTPAYMAPEMAAHNPSELGVVSDVYLLGAVLYEIVTGHPPHPRSGDTGEALLAAAANDIVPTDKTGELVDIARRAMATRVDDRYQSVKEFQEALREYQSHRESIALTDSADGYFASAERSGSSDEYARARFAYEEAIRLWPGNSRAARRLRTATLAHAKNALDQENFELGISILDSDDPEHREMLGKLERRRASRRRLHWFSKVAALTAAGAILAVAVVTVSKNRELDKQYAEARLAKLRAEDNELKARSAKQEAEEKASLARRAEQRAKKSRDAALAAKVEARRAEAAAQSERRKAEVAAYASDIGLAAESIRRNAYNKATAILSGMKPDNDAQAESVRARLRHIEWGLLEDASKPGPVKNLLGGDRVIAVGGSIDGRVIAAGLEDGAAKIWLRPAADAAISDPVSIDLAGPLTALAVSPDGRYLATAIDHDAGGSGATPIDVWEINGRPFESPLQRLIGHTAEILSLAFSPDGQQLVSSAADRTARVWKIGQPQPLAVIRDHLDRRVWNAGFSPDQSRVVTACDDGRVRVWAIDPTTSDVKKIHDLRGHEGPVYAAVFSRDGRRVYSGGYDRRLLVWELDDPTTNNVDGQTVNVQALLEGSRQSTETVNQVGGEDQQHEASIRCIGTAMIDGVEYVLSGGNDNTLRVWHASRENWTLDKVLRGHGRWVRSCAFIEQGRRIASGAHDGMKLWRWRDYAMPRELYPIAERRFGKDPSEMGASAATDSVYSGDGRWVATAYENGTVALWDMARQDRAASQLLVDGHALLTARGRFFDDGERMMTSAGDNTTRLWDVATGTQQTRLRGTGWRGAASVHWREDQATAHIVTGSDRPDVPAWSWTIQDSRLQSRRPLVAGLTEKDNRLAEITVIEHSPRGDYVVLGDAEGRCQVVPLTDASTEANVTPFPAHASEIRALAVAPDGDSFFTADADGQMKRWRIDDRSSAARGETTTDRAGIATLLAELPWSGAVTAMDISDSGDSLLVGYEPGDANDLPVANLFRIDDASVHQVASLGGGRDGDVRGWANKPVVQSVQFVEGSRRGLISLYFPAAPVDGDDSSRRTGQRQGYRVGYWNWNNSENDFEHLSIRGGGEISSAVLRERRGDRQLLLVGGKGARLWQSGGRESRFAKLVGSYRPSATITTIDFSHDRRTGTSRRLIAGDREGGVRVWELADDRWNERGAAAHLVGEHDHPLVATVFLPGRDDRFVSADRSGRWKVWQYDGRWKVVGQSSTEPSLGPLNCLVVSPSGNVVLAGTDRGAVVWRADDDGDFNPVAKPWQTGRVIAAQFSSDGSWIVTSDGDRSVAIWDAGGQPISRLSDEDAKGTTAMCFTEDRRRFVTGHRDKRIVIWDTSRLVDESQRGTNGAGRSIKELLTLEEHRRGVSSVSISPNGRDLVTAGEEGRTIVWSGATIAPVTLSPSRDQVTIRPNGQASRLDPGMMLNDPSRLADFRGATLSVEIVGTATAGERLSLADAALEKHRVIQFAETSDKTGEVLYQPYPDAETIAFGTLVRAANDASLQVRFNDHVGAEMVQALLRAISYRYQAGIGGDAEETVTTAITPANDSSTPLVADEGREVRISICSIRVARISPTAAPSSGTQFLPDLETGLQLEIEATLGTAGDDSGKSQTDGNWTRTEATPHPAANDNAA